AQDLKQLGVNDRIIAEPKGGAHRDPQAAIASVATAIADMLKSLDGKKPKALIKDRRDKYLNMGDKGLAS
ncbi:MAG: acetyl-CoA carboxylase carboxyl transferase subunit alpha, partial [Marinomonas sp.]